MAKMMKSMGSGKMPSLAGNAGTNRRAERQAAPERHTQVVQ